MAARRSVRGRFPVDWPLLGVVGKNGPLMNVESRDSVSLKPAELDEFGQFVAGIGLPIDDQELDRHVEQFPLVALCVEDEDLHGFMFGSLERIGGTPCILWGLGAARKGRSARATLEAMVGELYRRAAISFPDEDVLVAGAHRPAGRVLAVPRAQRRVPRPGYIPNGEERAWGRRLARRFGCDAGFDDRRFRVKAARRLRGGARRPPREGWAGRSRQLVGDGPPRQGRGDDRLRLGDGRRAGRRSSAAAPPDLSAVAATAASSWAAAARPVT